MNESKTYTVEEAKGVAKFLLDQAELSGNKFSPEQEKLYQSIVDQIKAATPEATTRKTVAEAPVLHRGTASQQPSGPLFKEASGNVIRSYLAGDRMCNSTQLEVEDIGTAILALMKDKVDSLPKDLQIKKMGEYSYRNELGQDSVGSNYAIPALVSSKILDIMREWAIATKYGAPVIPMSSDSLRVVQLTRDPQVQWRGQTPWTTINTSNPEFGKCDLSIFNCAALCSISEEYAHDAVNVEKMIAEAMSSAMTEALDKAVLGIGADSDVAGTNRPVGILDSNAVYELPASPLGIGDYSLPLFAIEHILSQKWPSDRINELVWAMAPPVARTYMSLTAQGSGTYLEPPLWVREIRRTTSTLLTDGLTSDSPPSTKYCSIYGSFAEAVLIGMSTAGIRFSVDQTGITTDSDGRTYDALSGFGYHLRLRARIAVALPRASLLVKSTGELANVYQAGN